MKARFQPAGMLPLRIPVDSSRGVRQRWFNELIDPTGESLVKIVVGLKLLDIDAAREFVQRYLGEVLEDEGEDEVDRSTNTE